MSKKNNTPLPTEVPLHLIITDSDQPRRTFDEKENIRLAASIAKDGLLQPILLRPVLGIEPLKYKVVYGHRRLWACKYNKMETITATVRELTDEQAFQYQMVENLQRQDMSPLDEAAAFLNLSKSTANVEQLAALVNKSRQYVADRLKLNDLSEYAKASLSDGVITVSHAIVLSRLNHTDQESVLKAIIVEPVVEDGKELTEFTKPYCNASLTKLKDMVADRFLYMEKANFNLEDADLVPAAGACISCPKRTCNNQLLFATITPDDKCTDAACFKNKVNTHVAKVQQELQKTHPTVLTGGKDAYSSRVVVNGDRMTAYDTPKENYVPVVITKASRYSQEQLGKVVYVPPPEPQQPKTKKASTQEPKGIDDRFEEQFIKAEIPAIENLSNHLSALYNGVFAEKKALTKAYKAYLLERLSRQRFLFLMAFEAVNNPNYTGDKTSIYTFVKGLSYDEKRELTITILNNEFYQSLTVDQLLNALMVEGFYQELAPLGEESEDNSYPDTRPDEFTVFKFLRLVNHPQAKPQTIFTEQ